MPLWCLCLGTCNAYISPPHRYTSPPSFISPRVKKKKNSTKNMTCLQSRNGRHHQRLRISGKTWICHAGEVKHPGLVERLMSGVRTAFKWGKDVTVTLLRIMCPVQLSGLTLLCGVFYKFHWTQAEEVNPESLIKRIQVLHLHSGIKLDLLVKLVHASWKSSKLIRKKELAFSNLMKE